MLSSSSMSTTLGANCRARANSLRKLASLSPTHFERISGPLINSKWALQRGKQSPYVQPNLMSGNAYGATSGHLCRTRPSGLSFCAVPFVPESPGDFLGSSQS